MPSYSHRDYGWMLNDTGRVQAYADAMRRAITPGAVVADIGTGTGFFALLACKMGASRVFAIEPNTSIQIARELAIHNGYADQIVFYNNFSFDVVLPERADVIISDLRGALPLQYPNIEAIVDARHRFLKPGGTLIGQQDTLWVAGIDSIATYAPMIAPWKDTFGLDLTPAQKFMVDYSGQKHFSLEYILLEPQCWGKIDYRTITNPNMQGELTWQAARSGTLHGFAVWFDALLADGIGFSNAPGQERHGYRQTFFPLGEPIALEPGDLVTVKLWANLFARQYLWTWRTFVAAEGGQGPVKADLRHSTFRSQTNAPFSIGPGHTAAPGLSLNQDGLIARFVLDYFATRIPLEEIASLLIKMYPKRFPDLAAAHQYVQRLADQYTTVSP